MKIKISYPQIIIESKEIAVNSVGKRYCEEMSLQEKADFIWYNMSQMEKNNSQGYNWLKSAIEEGYCGIAFLA
jgi:hypothetical protein